MKMKSISYMVENTKQNHVIGGQFFFRNLTVVFGIYRLKFHYYLSVF